MGKGLSITAFVLSLIIGPVGCIIGIIVLVQNKGKKEDYGKGFAIAAVVIGGLSILALLLAIAAGAFFYLVGGPTSTLPMNKVQLSGELHGINALYDSGTKKVMMDIENNGADNIHINKVSLEQCPDSTNSNYGWDIGRDGRGFIVLSCPALQKGTYEGDITIEYVKEGASLKQSSVGMVYLSVH